MTKENNTEKKSEKRSIKKSKPSEKSTAKRAPIKAARKSKKGVIKVFHAPMLPIHDVILFPYTLTPLVIEKSDLQTAVNKVMEGDKLIALFPEIPEIAATAISNQLPLDIDKKIPFFEHNGKKLSKTGVACRIVKKLRFPDDSIRLLVRGLKRIQAISVKSDNFLSTVRYKHLKEVEGSSVETVALTQNVIMQFQEIISLSPMFPEELKIAILNIDDSARLIDMITDALNLTYTEKLYLLLLPTLQERLQLLAMFLHREAEVLKVGAQIQMQVNTTLGQSQREIFLREQLKVIKKELGEDNKNPDIIIIEKKMKELDLPEKVIEVLQKEIEKLEMIPQAAAEYNVSHTYIDWLLSVPWNNWTEDNLDLKKAIKVLDADHYNLKKIKERILEFLAVLQLKKDRKSPILCFVGPPGVGKTSLGQSIAKAMGRKFVRMSLGGIRDEAEIRGHRRTYVGALPGRIIQGLKKAESGNPLFMLDEIDKIGTDFRGDPASALLEVLDPQQNSSFNDHYLELDYDLSAVTFIATANITDTIPPALLDRMEIMHLPGYTANEKKHIAKRFLIPRQLKDNGLKQSQLFFPMSTVEDIVTYYCREAGVRKLERTVGKVCRKVARKIVEGDIDPKVRTTVKSEDLEEYLGPKVYLQDEAEKKPEIGLATGMAWTSVGGVILPVEVTSMPGKGGLQLTGSLGNVMKESAQTAFSLVKSRGKKYKIKDAIFAEKDFHIHVPDGATPKDGPSAGITIVTALISHLTNRAVRPETAMTGEITLRGKITPVGGIKEKVIAALSAGIKNVVLPKKNQKDLNDIPDDVRKKLNFTFVTDVDEALKFLLINK